jgi:Fis family transcriptional regulator
MSKYNIETSIRESLHGYFVDLGGEQPHNMYDMLVQIMERPLLEVVMDKADHNQSRAAEWLGLNRNTLRKKLVEHDLLHRPVAAAPAGPAAVPAAGAGAAAATGGARVVIHHAL